MWTCGCLWRNDHSVCSHVLNTIKNESECARIVLEGHVLQTRMAAANGVWGVEMSVRYSIQSSVSARSIKSVPALKLALHRFW